MQTSQLIEQLQSTNGSGAPVLSAFLDLNPALQVKRAYRTVFKDMVRERRAPLDKRERLGLEREAERVSSFLEKEEPHGRSLAVFSCASMKLWRAHFLPVPVSNHLTWEPWPDVAPLIEAEDEYQRYAVALVDKEKARLFVVWLGRIEESRAFEDFVFGKHDQGGPSQANFQRHHEAHVQRHLKRVEERLTELLRERAFDRLILAGPEEATTELRDMLRTDLERRLVATIPAETSARASEILEKTLEVERQTERESESALLSDLQESAGAGGRATLGLAPTLESLWLREVRTLVVADGVHTGGAECPTCGRLLAGDPTTCPLDGAKLQRVHDVFHRSMARAVEQSGQVEVVHDEPADRLRQAGEGIGAQLRFK